MVATATVPYLRPECSRYVDPLVLLFLDLRALGLQGGQTGNPSIRSPRLCRLSYAGALVLKNVA